VHLVDRREEQGGISVSDTLAAISTQKGNEGSETVTRSADEPVLSGYGGLCDAGAITLVGKSAHAV